MASTCGRVEHLADQLLELALWLLASNRAAASLLLRVVIGPAIQTRIDAALGVHLPCSNHVRLHGWQNSTWYH